MKCSIGLKTLCLLAPVLIGSSLALAQTTGTTVTYPQDNVRGGAIGARRPGLAISAAIARHRERATSVFQDHGGADPQPGTGNERHVLLVTTFLQGIFNMAQNIADAVLLAAQVSGTGT